MKWFSGMAALAATLAGGCDQIAALGPPQAASAPAPVERAVVPDLRPAAGLTYAEFAAAYPQYAMQALGLPGPDAARLAGAMAVQSPGWVAQGGGAQAVVFVGCADAPCSSDRGVVAVDVATGAVFAGVRDGAGSAELAPNARLEALLRLNSPTRSWENPTPRTVSAAP